MTDTEIDAMTTAYLVAALWSSTDDDDDPQPLDDAHGVEDIAPESVATARADCQAFSLANVADLEGMDAGQAGHDLWLTRNGHGAGYWDRGLGDRGDRLTAAAHALGELDPYVGDDGQVYL